MAKNKVFIGYDYDNDKAAKDRLLGWDTNKEFDFSSYDRSFDVTVESEEAVAIKQDLAARIGDSSRFPYPSAKRPTTVAGWLGKSGKRSNSRRSSWPLRPIRLTTRRPQCRGLGRRGARCSTSTPSRKR